METLKDIYLGEEWSHENAETIKEKAIKFFKYGLKKRMNPYMIFLRFHNLTEEDLK